MEIKLGITFDDVLLVPQYSTVTSRQNVNLSTKVSKNVSLNIPIVSSNMDTVTEDKMAIAMAREGGIGIIHRYCSISDQVEMVKRVKRAESYIITDPYTVNINDTISDIRNKIKRYRVSTYFVIDVEDNMKGIITRRDIKGRGDYESVGNCMTKIEKIISGDENTTIDEAKKIMIINKIQKLPLLRGNLIKGLICLKDIERVQNHPLANLDSCGRLRCGAAIGVKEDDIGRAQELIEAGVDVLVIDVAHGDSELCINTLRKCKEKFPKMDVIAGNVATGEGAKRLILAGADGIKVNIGAGSICTTRIVSGCGVPQFTALMDVAPICKEYNVPCISDGGNRNSGNMCKALAVGASCIMLGRMIAGTDESPGKILIKDNKRVKMIRGMAGLMANISNSIRQGIPEPNTLSFTPEGVEGYVPYTGPLHDTLNQICNGIKSGVSYCGSHNISEMQLKAQFIRITPSGISESHVHDISQ